MNYLEEAIKIFSKDNFATDALGAEILDAGKRYAKCRVKLTDIHKNAMGGVMGGVPYTLADFTFAIASNLDNLPTVTLSSTISYIGACKGEYLISEAKCIKDGRSICTFEISIKDELENQVALIVMNGFHKV